MTLQVRLILDQTHLAGIRYALDSIPGDISGIVNSTLKMIKVQDEHRAKLANQALALLTAVQAPLTAEAMCHALGLANALDDQERPPKLDAEDIPNAESIIECCMGLIKIEPTTKVVTLAQYDILPELRQEWASFFAPEHTARLAKTCIAYLSLEDFSKGPYHEMDAFKKRLEEHPFLDYASKYWGYHARTALLLAAFEADVNNDIHRFLKQSMNVGLSLQVSEYDVEGKQKTPVIEPDRFLGASELQIASRHGLTAVVKRSLRSCQDSISNADWYGRTALHEAAQAGWDDIVSMLIKAGANSSLMDNEDRTPFEYAAKSGHAKVIEILQDRPGRSGHNQQALEQMLYDAAEAGDTSAVEALLKFPVNPNAEKSGVSALTVAARRGHKGIVRLLLNEKASASHNDSLPTDYIPLHQAIRNLHMEIAALLLRLGANIDARDDLGRTALSETLGTPDLRGAALLLKNGTDISLQDFKGNNILHEAARRGAVEHALRFVDRGIDIFIPNKDGLTALHLAAWWGHYEIAHLLVEKSADVKDYGSSGWASPPLPKYAGLLGNQQLSMVADEAKIRQEISSISKQEAIHHQNLRSPGDYRSYSKVRLSTLTPGASKISQFEQNTEINKDSGLSTTPLMLAAAAGHIRILELLLYRRKAIEELKVAIELAKEAGHEDIVDLLLLSAKSKEESLTEERQ